MATLQEPFTALPQDLRPECQISRTPPRSFHSVSGTPETRQSSSRDSKSSPPSHRSARKQPSYEESALQIHSSPPLTSFLNDRHSASSAQEEAYLKHASRLRVIRFILSFLTLGTAGAAVGLTAHTLKTYNDTRLSKNWHLPLWPIDIDIKPTLGVLIPASIAAFSSLIYILIALIPSVSPTSPSHKHPSTNSTTTATIQTQPNTPISPLHPHHPPILNLHPRLQQHPNLPHRPLLPNFPRHNPAWPRNHPQLHMPSLLLRALLQY